MTCSILPMMISCACTMISMVTSLVCFLHSWETLRLLLCWHVLMVMLMWWMNYWQQSLSVLTNWVGSVSAYLSISTTVEGNDELVFLLPSGWRVYSTDCGQRGRPPADSQEADQGRSQTWSAEQGGYTPCHLSSCGDPGCGKSCSQRCTWVNVTA